VRVGVLYFVLKANVTITMINEDTSLWLIVYI